MYRKIALGLVLLCGSVSAHEWTPTYPELKYSFVDGVMVAEMQLFNTRKEISYYKISVFDNQWNAVPFSTGGDNIIQISHLQRKKVNVYIREKDVSEGMYVCSRSKSIVDGKLQTFLSSRICSKIK